MSTIEASFVLPIIIFASMLMISFSLTICRNTNTYTTNEIAREHSSYTKNNKTFVPYDALRISSAIDDLIRIDENGNNEGE